LRFVSGKLRGLFRNEVLYMGSDALVKVIAFFAIPIYIRLMPASQYGLFSVYQTYFSLFNAFFGLTVARGVVRYYVAMGDRKKHLTTGICISLSCSVVFSVVILAMRLVFHVMNITVSALLTVCVYALFQTLVDLGMEDLRARLKAVYYSLCDLFTSLFSASFAVFLLYILQSNQGYWLLVSNVVPIGLLGLFLSFHIIRRDGLSFERSTARYLLAYSIPLLPYAFSSIIISQINRFFLAQLSLTQTGIYSFTAAFTSIMMVVSLSINRAFQPFLFNALKTQTNFRSRMYQNMGLFYVTYIVFIAAADLVIGIMGKGDYLAASSVIPIITLGYGYFFLFSLQVNFFYYHGKNIFVSVFSIASAALIFLFNALLIPKYGYYGAAVSTALAYFFQFLMSYIYINWKLKIKTIPLKIVLGYQALLLIPVAAKLFLF